MSSSGTPPAAGRLIVELSPAGTDPAALRSAAELARWLGLHLHGVFVEDEALLALAAFPFAREFRLPAHEWAPFAVDRLAEELRHAAEQARRVMQEVGVRLDVPNVFEVLRGDPATCIAGVCATTDIVVVMQPGAGATADLARLSEAARGMRGSVLLLPSGVQVRSGPVVALLRDAEDSALDVAARVAATGEGALMILLPEGPGDPGSVAVERAVALGLPRSRITLRRMPDAHADAALAGVRERLLVVGRSESGLGSAGETARMAAVRRVPVLVAEPPGLA